MGYPYQSILDLSIMPDLCRLGPFMNLLTGVFRTWMIYHFADAARIIDNNLKKRIWTEDPETQIAIESHAAYKTELTESRPAIIIKRQDWKRVKIGIADRRMGELPADGSELYTNFWQGVHTLFCIGGTPGEAEILGTEVFKDLNEFAPAVRRKLSLMRLEVAEAGGYAKLDESGKNYVVPVNVGYVLQESWILRQEAPFLKRLDLSLMGF